MAIHAQLGFWYCFRNPRHKGQNIAVLLHKLNIPKHEYAQLELKEEGAVTYEDTRDYSAWRYFDPAEENQEALDYLEARLFSDPVSVCKQFNLKVAKEGKWCGRLLIPLHPVGWTGRAMRSHLTLRYDAWTSESSFFLYKQNSSSCILLEGSLDCMRTSSVSTQFDTIGKCRMALSPAILSYLRDANYTSIYHSPDANVELSAVRAERSLIRSYCTTSEVYPLLPLNGRKDFGDTPEEEVRQLLSGLGKSVSYV